MNAKAALTAVLLAFVVATVTYMVAQGRPGGSAARQPISGMQTVPAPQVRVDSAVSAPPEVKTGHAAAARPRQVSDGREAAQSRVEKSVEGSSKPRAVAKTSVRAPTHWVFVYYFHNTIRCESCKKIELFTQEAIQTTYKKEIDEGTVAYFAINLDEVGNEHFTKDYKLYTKSVIVADIHDGKQTRWKNLEKVWELLNDHEGFMKYIVTGVDQYVKAD